MVVTCMWTTPSGDSFANDHPMALAMPGAGVVHLINTMLGNIKCAITGTYRALRKKHMVRYLAEFEWRFNHRFDLAAMIPALGRAAVATKPQPYWWLKMADYGA
jgi:hypothetical protein